MRRRRERELRKAARREAIRAARAKGCTCDPEVVFDLPSHPVAGLAAEQDRIVSATLRHDDWCPLLRVAEERPPGLARLETAVFPFAEEPPR